MSGLVCTLAVVLSGLVFCSSVNAMNRKAVCEDTRVRIIGDPDARWFDSIAGACATLSVLRDRDETAEIRLFADGPDLLVHVSLEDGRSASRVVHRPDSLAVTLEALLSVPTVLRDTGGKTQGGQKPSSFDPESPLDDKYGHHPNDWDDDIGFEAGASIGSRFAGPGPQVAASVAAFAQLRLRSWLVGMGMRGDIVEARAGETPPAFEMDTVAISLNMARRIRLSNGYLDLGASPRFVLDTQGADLAVDEVSDSKTDVRFALFARLGWGLRNLRLVLEADIEVSPEHLRRDVRIDPMLPVLPSWTAGLGVGASWSEP